MNLRLVVALRTRGWKVVVEPGKSLLMQIETLLSLLSWADWFDYLGAGDELGASTTDPAARIGKTLQPAAFRRLLIRCQSKITGLREYFLMTDGRELS